MFKILIISNNFDECVASFMLAYVEVIKYTLPYYYAISNLESNGKCFRVFEYNNKTRLLYFFYPMFILFFIFPCSLRNSPLFDHRLKLICRLTYEIG